MADNPFAQYATSAAASDNPFAQFAVSTEGVPSGRQPAFEGSKAHLIPGAETDIAPTPKYKDLGVVGRAKDILKGAVEVPTTMAYNLATMPIAAVATGGKPEQWANALKAPESETGRYVLEKIGQGAEALKIPALTPGMLVPQGGNLVRPAIAQANRLTAPAVEAGVNALTPIVERVKAPLEARKERIAAEKSAESYRRAPQIEAAKGLADLGVAVNPATSNPTIKTRTRQFFGGKGQTDEKIAEFNRQPVHNAIAEDLGLPPESTTLDEAAFDKARAQVAPAYDAVRGVELFKADKEALSQLEKLRRDPALIADKTLKGEIDSLVDSAVGRIGEGLTGDELLNNVSDLRAKAKVLRDNPNKGPRDVDIADTYMGIANTLEELIDSNIGDPKMLSNYKQARQTMAKSYVAQEITDLATGVPDVSKLARLASKPNALTGNLEKLAKGAANFPDAFTAAPPGMREVAGTFTRSGVPGTAGYLLGHALGGGYMGGVTGAALGGVAGYLGSRALAKGVTGRGYQLANAIPQDFRIMPNQLAAQISQTPGVPAVYDWRNALNEQPQINPMEPNLGNVPNWVPGREAPAVEIPRLAAPSAEAELGRVQQQRQFQYGQEAAAAERAAQAAEAEAAAGRKPATGGQVYELDPVTGKLRAVDQGLKGATPEVIRDTGANLASAAEKVSGGQKFAMSASEKIAWDRTKVDLAELAPGFDKLSDKAIAERMADRNWAQQMVQKARDQARAFEEIAARAADERARQEAFAARERMMDLAEMLDEQLRVVKPKKIHQGPKTREAKRNALRGSLDNLNALVQ